MISLRNTLTIRPSLLVAVSSIYLLMLGDCHHATEPPPPGQDTTSHNFIWEIDTLGAGNSSNLRDVAFINDTLVYAVGEISVLDTSGQFRNPPYNVAMWNGQSWALSTTADSGYLYGPLYAVLAFGPSDLWVGSSIPEHWDGKRWTFYGSTRGYQGGFWIRKIWGSSSNALYVVGDGGNIRWFDGNTWQRVESGTSGTIQDVWGGIDDKTGQPVVLCAVSEAYSIGGQKILRISRNNVVDTVTWVSQRRPHSVWFGNSSQVFVCGDGVFMRDPQQLWHEIAGTNIIPTFTERIRGQSPEDVFVVGDFGKIAHYNGADFRVFPGIPDADFYSCDFKDNRLIAVGWIAAGQSAGRAIIVRMRR